MPFANNKQRRFLEGLKNNPAFQHPVNLAAKPLNVSHVPAPLHNAMGQAPHPPALHPLMASPGTGGLPPVPAMSAPIAPIKPITPPSTMPPLGGSGASPMPAPVNRFKGIKAKLK